MEIMVNATGAYRRFLEATADHPFTVTALCIFVLLLTLARRSNRT